MSEIHRIVFSGNSEVERAIRLAALFLIVISGFTVLTPTVMLASAQPTVTETSAPGMLTNEYYIFTQELNADKEKLGIPTTVFSLENIIVHMGDTVTIHFYNTAVNPDERHTFTMQSPYDMNYDLDGGQDTTFSFTANTVGGFTYYSTFDLPTMIGHLEVLP
jgi:plastocyanin